LNVNAKVDFGAQELKILYNEQKARIPVSVEGVKRQIITQDFEELNEEIDEMVEEYEDEDFEEYEDESDLDERESFNIEWAKEVEDSEVWKENLNR